ncbi:MAG: hypothetical protein ACE5GA_03565 [Candidatus Zixiibacteriota bacterium]
MAAKDLLARATEGLQQKIEAGRFRPVPTFQPSQPIPTLSDEFAPDFAQFERFLNAFREQTFQRIDRGKANLRDRLASQGLVRSGELEERLFLDVENPLLAELESTAAQAGVQFAGLETQFGVEQFRGAQNIFNTLTNAQLQGFLQNENARLQLLLQQRGFAFEEDQGGGGFGLGSLVGSVAGSFLGPIGGAIGSRIGEKIFPT